MSPYGIVICDSWDFIWTISISLSMLNIVPFGEAVLEKNIF